MQKFFVEVGLPPVQCNFWWSLTLEPKFWLNFTSFVIRWHFHNSSFLRNECMSLSVGYIISTMSVKTAYNGELLYFVPVSFVWFQTTSTFFWSKRFTYFPKSSWRCPTAHARSTVQQPDRARTSRAVDPGNRCRATVSRTARIHWHALDQVWSSVKAADKAVVVLTPQYPKWNFRQSGSPFQ